MQTLFCQEVTKKKLLFLTITRKACPGCELAKQSLLQPFDGKMKSARAPYTTRTRHNLQRVCVLCRINENESDSRNMLEINSVARANGAVFNYKIASKFVLFIIQLGTQMGNAHGI